jgi:hypothetical protein
LVGRAHSVIRDSFHGSVLAQKKIAYCDLGQNTCLELLTLRQDIPLLVGRKVQVSTLCNSDLRA